MSELKKYRILIDAEIESSLSKEELEGKLTVALYDVENEEIQIDGESDELYVIEYNKTEAEELDECPFCGSLNVECVMEDIDGTNLIEVKKCLDCNRNIGSC